MSVYLQKRNQGLDILRALAIILVIIIHSKAVAPSMPETLQAFARFGWSGVDLFFVLSGFLIGKQVFAVDKTNLNFKYKLRNFWLKRWFRTLPLYYSVFGIYLLLKIITNYSIEHINFGYLIFIQNYLGITDFDQSWSLCIEEQFYLIFPLLAYSLRLSNRSPLIWLLPIFISIYSRFMLYNDPGLVLNHAKIVANTITFPTHTHLDGISIGVILARTFPFWKNWSHIKKKISFLLGISIVILSFYFNGPHLFSNFAIYLFTLISIGFGFMLIGLYDIKINKHIFSIIYKISLWSYGIYLWNSVLVRILPKLNLNLLWGSQTLIFIGLSLLLAAITFYLIEKPFLNIRDRLLSKLATYYKTK